MHLRCLTAQPLSLPKLRERGFLLEHVRSDRVLGRESHDDGRHYSTIVRMVVSSDGVSSLPDTLYVGVRSSGLAQQINAVPASGT